MLLLLLETALAGDGEATLAISGGSTPKLMFGYLAKAGFDWSACICSGWMSEAFRPTDEQSNYRMTEKFHPSRPDSARNVHRIRAELPPDVAAKNYEEEIVEYFGLEPGELPHFDLVHLGVGPDHIRRACSQEIR